MKLSLNNQKHKFSLPEDLTYINCAYMSPMMKSVEEVGVEGMAMKRNPTLVKPNDFFDDTEELRNEYAKIINCNEPNRIVISGSVSYGIANVAKNITVTKEENIIVLGEQFASNYYPWKKKCDQAGAELRVVKASETLQDREKIWNENLLEAIDKNTKVVAMPHIHWADGTLYDLEAIRKRTRDVGALLIIDGTQSVGALPFDVQKYDPDALICAGYKWLLGPYSIGLSYYGEYFDGGDPIEENWINRLHSEDFAGLVAYEDDYQPGALRYEIGEHSNFILIPMLLEAVKQINEWGVEGIQAYCKSLVDNTIDQVKNAHVAPNQYRASHLFGIRFPGGDMNKIQSAFQDNKISVSVRGDAVRISPHLYNTEEDMLKLVSVINNNI